MSRSTPINVAASVKQRLLNRARANNEDFNLLLTKYGLERILYRISKSRHQDPGSHDNGYAHRFVPSSARTQLAPFLEFGHYDKYAASSPNQLFPVCEGPPAKFAKGRYFLATARRE